ncbi:MAG: hypothetical protein H0X50_00820 [Nitrosopumilus sp.]|nr:hypothetical protein [Nitrosopumilus sp.]
MNNSNDFNIKNLDKGKSFLYGTLLSMERHTKKTINDVLLTESKIDLQRKKS